MKHQGVYIRCDNPRVFAEVNFTRYCNFMLKAVELDFVCF